MDDHRGGGVGQLQRFPQGGPGGQGGRQIGGDTIARADDINFSAKRQRRQTLDQTRRIRAHHAVFGKSNEAGTPLLAGQRRRRRSNFLERKNILPAGEPGKFRPVHFEGDGRITCQAPPAVRHNEQFRTLFLDGANGLQQPPGNDARFRQIRLF